MVEDKPRKKKHRKTCGQEAKEEHDAEVASWYEEGVDY